MRAIIEYAVAHRVTILMVTLAAVLFGYVSLGRLPMQLLPDISYPTLTVQTELPDSAPGEVEALLTRPLEESVGVVPGLRRVHSISQPGVSEITLEFGWGTSMDFAALDVREKMDMLQLPEKATAPLLLRFDPTLDPVLRLGLSGESNMVHLRHLAEHVVKKELESLDGVAAAKIVGGLQEQVHVDVDEARLAQLGVPIVEVARMVGAENVNAAGGRLRDSDSQYLVRTLNEFESIEDIAATIILRSEGRVVRLGDVAEVTRAWKEREIVSRIDGRPAVEIAVYKEGDANIVEVAKRVRRQIPRLGKMLDGSGDLTVLTDQSTFIESAVQQVRNNAMLGGVLAILVLLLFLRDFRSTAIIAVSIPTSIVATFILMYRQGVSLNIMSLGGLALGVGMLVDNSIVVLESIVRHRRSGADLTEAAVEGTAEVGQAVTASTLTTIAVFLPILFVEGVARQIFKDQALTVTYALLVSLVVALTLTPMLAALGRRRPSSASGKLQRTEAPSLHAPETEGLYARILESALSHKAAVLVGAFGLFAAVVLGSGGLGSELIPSLSQGEFRFDLELAEGTPIESTDEILKRVEERVAAVAGVEHVFANVGVDARESGTIRNKKEHHAELNIRLGEGIRGDDEEAIISKVRAELAQFDTLNPTLLRPSYFSFKTPIAIEIYGYDLNELDGVARQVVAALGNVEGLRDVRSSVQPGSPEVQIRFDRDKLKIAGLGLRDASEAMRTKILGEVATDLKDRDRQIDVLVRSGEAQSVSFDELQTMVVGYKDQAPVRLASVANVKVERGPSRIERIAQTRAVTVTANLVGRDLGSVSRDIDVQLAGVPLPADVTLDMGGQNEEMRGSLRSLQFAAALALFLVYLVMASQFESLLNPFLILFSVPLAFIGVWAGLKLTQTPVSVVVMIGAIMLAGIVVNNGIVLVDLIGQLRRRGVTVHNAILQAGRTRLRPIVMTTTTTVLGLLPMAVFPGEGSEIGSPLAITVIGGLLVSTVLTLVVIPVLYATVHREA